MSKISTLEELKESLEKALTQFRENGTVPETIQLGKGCSVDFLEETWEDDEDFHEPLLRSKKNSNGLQVHEKLNGVPFSKTDNEDEKSGGWVILKSDTPETIALQILSDFDI